MRAHAESAIRAARPNKRVSYALLSSIDAGRGYRQRAIAATSSKNRPGKPTIRQPHSAASRMCCGVDETTSAYFGEKAPLSRSSMYRTNSGAIA